VLQPCVCVCAVSSARYQMDDVAMACCDFLVKHLEPANVIGIARFAEGIGCTELHQHSREYINTHFNEVGGVRFLIPYARGYRGLVCCDSDFCSFFLSSNLEFLCQMSPCVVVCFALLLLLFSPRAALSSWPGHPRKGDFFIYLDK